MKALSLIIALAAFCGCHSLPDVSHEKPFVDYVGKDVSLYEDQVVVKVSREMANGILPRWLVSVPEYEDGKPGEFEKIASFKKGDRVRIVRLVRRLPQNDLVPGTVLYAIGECQTPSGNCIF